MAVLAVQLVSMAVALAQLAGQGTPHTDFSQLYTSAVVWRTGGHVLAYDPASERTMSLALGLATPSKPVLPNAWAPGALLLGTPLTLLPIVPALALWDVIQVGLLACAVAIVAAAAPWPAHVPSRVRTIVAVVAATGAASTALAISGQWAGPTAFGIAMAHRHWRRGEEALATSWLVGTALLAKPHLGLVLAAFAMARCPRRALPAGVATAALTTGVWLLAVGPAGLGNLASTVLWNVPYTPSAALVSILGLVSGLDEGRQAPALLGVAALAIGIVAGAWLGRLSRGAGDRPRLEATLAAALLVTVLTAPHVFVFDLAILAPGLVLAGSAVTSAGRWDGRLAALLVGWAGVGAAAMAALLPLGSDRSEPLIPILLAAGCAVLVTVARRRPDPAPGRGVSRALPG